MLSAVFCICYYLTFVFIPFGVVSWFNKHNVDVFSLKDWIYLIKSAVSVLAIYKIKRHKAQTNQCLEERDQIKTDKDFDTQVFYGCDKNDNSLTIKITLHKNLTSEIYLCLKLQNGKTYTFPETFLDGSNVISAISIPSFQWKGKGLSIETLEPFKRTRINFNGMLRDVNNNNKNNAEFVQFSFIWNCAIKPIFLIEDSNSTLLSRGLINKVSVADYNKCLANDGYEQFGVLRGMLKIESEETETELYLTSCKSRLWGNTENDFVKGYFSALICTHDGLIISVTVKEIFNGAVLKYGSVLLRNRSVYSVQDIKINKDIQNLPNVIRIEVKANNETFKCVICPKPCDIVNSTNNNTKNGCKMQNVSTTCHIFGMEGTCVLECWNSFKGDNNESPKPVLTTNNVDYKPVLTVELTHDDSRLLNLTGGKGSSLGLLHSIKSEDFTVPDGFVVTAFAFDKQVDCNNKLKTAVTNLEKTCQSTNLNSIKEACQNVTKVFKAETILPSIEGEIKNLLKNYNEEGVRWAVRSSAIGEDSEELSAAGQNETFLGCRDLDQIKQSISACWASLYTYQSVEYRRQHGLPIKSSIAVVIQKMVSSESAGVLFTCHPATSNTSEMVVTANYGLGETVVSGQSEPDTIILKKPINGSMEIISKTIGTKKKVLLMNHDGVEEQNLNSIRSKQLCVTDEQAKLLGKVGLLLEKAFGNPRDIEWAFYKNQLYLLQSRPITTMNSWSDYELLHEFDTASLSHDDVFTKANVGEVMPGAVSVLTNTIILTSIDRAVQYQMKKTYDSFAKQMVPVNNHQVMLDVVSGIHRYVSKEITTDAHNLDLAIFGHPVLNEKIRQASVKRHGLTTGFKKFGLLLTMIRKAWNNQKMIKMMVDFCKNFKITFLPNDSILEMYNKIDSCWLDLLKFGNCHMEATHVSVFYQSLAMSVLSGNKVLCNDHYADIALLLSSCEDVVSAEVPKMLKAIAKTIKESEMAPLFIEQHPEEGVQFLKKQCPKAYQLFESFLEKHGHRLLGEFDLMKETWAMRPEQVIKMIQANCKSNLDLEKKSLTVDEIIAQLKSPTNNITKKLLKIIMQKNRNAVGIREQAKSEFIRSVNTVRIAFRTLAKKMVKEGVLPSEKLIFHLSNYEILKVITERSPHLINKAMRRQKLYNKWDAQRFPEIMYGLATPEPDEPIVVGDGDVVLKGTPVCYGDIKARACVITSLDDIDQLQSGDILVTYSTDIGWSPYFPILGGIVTELGGLVSHGAVVAREYGLPSIVGIQNVTSIFKTGDTLYLSGKNGTLSRLCED